MHDRTVFPERVELSILRRDNLFQVENRDGAVVVRAMRDNFSPREKEFFIRYLAAEGYIPELHRWSAEADSGWSPRLTWIAESAGLRSQNKRLRDVLRVIGCASLVWLALMVFAFLHAPR